MLEMEEVAEAGMDRVDAIIFDLGKVLITSDWERTQDRLAECTGKPRQEIDQYFSNCPHAHDLWVGRLSKRRFFDTVAKDLGFKGAYGEFALIWSDSIMPIEPMISLANSLKGHMLRLVLSNTNPIAIDYLLEHYSFLKDLDGHIFSYEVGLLKPDAAIYEHALAKYGLTAERTIFVDDNADYVEGARRVGLRTIHFQNPKQAYAELAKLGVFLPVAGGG
jgi:glucose-1-phosphatase